MNTVSKKINFLVLLTVTLISQTSHIDARHGSGAGPFFGGLATGAVIGSVASRDRRHHYRHDNDTYELEKTINRLERKIDRLERENERLRR